MTDKKFEARYLALTLWAADAEARGFRVPCPGDLASIARAKTVDVPGVDADLVGAWPKAIKEVMNQVAFNIAEPHRQLGPELDEPETDAGRKPATESRSDPSPVVGPGAPAAPEAQPRTPEARVLEALKAWRDGETANGRSFISNLKESHLHQVANSGVTTAEDIRRMLPPAAGRFADEVADVVGEPDPGASPSVPAVEVPVPTGPKGTVPAEPKSVPAAEPPVRQPAPAEAGRAPAEPIDPKSFAQFEYGPSTLNPVALTIRRDGDGARQYSWPHSGSDQPIKIYRVISSDDHPPYSPDRADLVCVAHSDSAVDGRPLGAAVRHLQVWLNEGPSIEAAVAAQPTLHAQGAFVGEVLGVNVTEDEGRIIGQWSALPGTRSVQVFRIPIEKAATAGGDPQYRILAESDNLGGFVDARAERGSHYLYQVYAEAVVDGVARLSSPANSSLKVSAVLEPVSDLEIRLSSDPDIPYFELEWSAPAGGTVSIYRTELPPTSGIELEALSADSLVINGLTDESRLSHPIALSQGRASMVSVPWPSGWTRAYFTPVTLLDGMALVGGTTFKSRREKVRNPKILERVNSQILTFDWPAGAASVLVYRGQTGDRPGAGAGRRSTGNHPGGLPAAWGIAFP
ncbi:hypothetical protein E5206_04080 [Arthrobacter sp. PAMC25564]|uniref:hypothetical protein n=1 Tax=Arthrobacter sp. PAMC25564 TaxID=2565366 RepID=UPI0010A27E1C|nr:hypothetical protein [Arthrobacter sp. PAMC25564]QCB96207.1 hypothetical protein E5206_04080 [Arthrobacter sp. PAMC25564]